MAKTVQEDHAYDVENSAPEPKSKKSKDAMASLERRFSALEERYEKRFSSMEKQIAKLTKERDEARAKYHEILAENRVLKKENLELKARIESLEKQLAWFRKEKFGKRSETNPFRDITKELSEPASGSDSLVLKTRRKRGQQPGSKRHGRSDQSSVPEEEIIIDVDDCVCPDCLKPYVCLPGTDDATIIELETLLYRMKYKRKRYVAACRCKGTKVITAPPAAKLYPRTTIGNSLWVHFCKWKFLHGVPTNRILKDLSLRGLRLSAGTVTGGYSIIDDLVTPLYESILHHCQGESYWNADETSWRVFSENDGSRNSKRWWLWVIAGRRAVSYLLDQSRSGQVPSDFLGGSSGLLMTDRFSAYKNLPSEISKAWCWVHVRRDFLRIYDGMPKRRAWAKAWLLEISQLFVLHHAKYKLYSEGKTFGRDWFSASDALLQHTENMRQKWTTQLQNFQSKEQQTALQSLKKHWAGLTLFLQDIRIPLGNNRAERLLRGCVVSRKNSYGSGVEWAGQLSAKLFSIFQTWLINDLDPEAMLLNCFDECAKTPGKPPPSIMKFLPWKMTDEQKRIFNCRTLTHVPASLAFKRLCCSCFISVKLRKRSKY